MSMDRRRFLQTSTAAAAAAVGCLPLLADAGAPVVRTSGGTVRGRRDAEGVVSFLGIPYGADTRGTRFMAPKPAEKWEGVRDCTEFAGRAPQLGGTHGMTSRAGRRELGEGYHLPADVGVETEDCLHLNVWAPAGAGHGRRPVLVYIHGGAYNSGTVNAALYDGARLAKRGDAVVVCVNHRLNAFGYLYLGEIAPDAGYGVSGNAGMLDLVLALEWVRDNAARFGGDPRTVTIWGQSGGGAKCATLMAMPAAKGLFHRVMTMSGQQVTGAPKSIATARAREFLGKLGLGTTAPEKLKAALDALPLEKLMEAATVSSAWLPVVDGEALPRDPFSPDAPPISDDVPMILGNTHDETRGLIGSANPALFALTWEEVPAALKKSVGSFLGPVTPEEVVAKYREWYPAYGPADVFFAAATAFRSWPGQVIEAERRAESPAQKRTWVYEMDWRSPVGGGKFGAPHTVDIPFFFDNLRVSPGMVGTEWEKAQPLAEAMSETLLAFARTGTPENAHVPRWPAYDLQRRATMVWDLPPRVVDDPRGKERVLAAEAHYRQPGT